MEYIDQTKAVYKKIAPYIRRTPAVKSNYFSQQIGATVILKCENFQNTHSFKDRGAFNKILSVTNTEKIFVAPSGGNHGMAVAYAAKQKGMKAIVIVPEFVAQYRIDMIKALGGEVVVYGNSSDELNAKAEEYAKDPKYIYIHPFNDDDVIAGQATVAYELLEEIPDLDVIVAPIGGGGLISGISQYAKNMNPKIKIYGVQTEGADAMFKSLQAGKVISLDKMTSIATSLGATRVADRTFAIVSKYVDKVVTVTDDEAVEQLRNLLDKEKLLVEPASSCSVAALTKHLLPDVEGKKVAVVLSAGNVSLELVKTYI